MAEWLCRLRRVGCAAMAFVCLQVLKSNIALKKIGFANNKIGREGCLALAEAARANACIKQVQVLPGAYPLPRHG